MTHETSRLAPARSPVPWGLRWGTRLLAVGLMLLFAWLLGFVVNDIGNIDAPAYEPVYDAHVDEMLRDRVDEIERQISEVGTLTAREQEVQRGLRRSMDNASETLVQMMALHRLALENGQAPTADERTALATAQRRFLEAQDRFEAANDRIAAHDTERFDLRQRLQSTREEIATQEEPARDAWKVLLRRHELRLAAMKLAFIVPVFIISAGLVFRFRRSTYRSITVALLVASGWRVGVVMFEHFPREYFKYIAIGAAIAIVLAFLVWLLRKVAAPDRGLLVKRYREAYRNHVCPVCSFPIARGPLRFARWTRKGPRFPMAIGDPAESPAIQEPYVCPSCGHTLFEACAACGKLRHSMLPFCEHCGSDEVGTPDGA